MQETPFVTSKPTDWRFRRNIELPIATTTLPGVHQKLALVRLVLVYYQYQYQYQYGIQDSVAAASCMRLLARKVSAKLAQVLISPADS